MTVNVIGTPRARQMCQPKGFGYHSYISNEDT